jgi:hypothetical protein
MNEIIKKRLLLMGIVFGMLITISPFIAFVIGVRKFLHGFDGLGATNDINRLTVAPAEMMNGMLTYAISINESNYLCPIGLLVMLVCFAIYTSIPKKTPPPLPCNISK